MNLLHKLENIIKILHPEYHYSKSCQPDVSHSGKGVELKDSINSNLRKITYNDLVTVKHKIKRSFSTHIKEWFYNLILRGLHLQELDQDGSERNIQVEYDNVDTLKRHKKPKYFKHIVQVDHANKDLSPFLTLHPLREGKFCAEIKLEHFPSDGDIVICVSGYKLQIYILNREIKSKKISRAMKCGEINLPIFIDPKTLRIQVDNSKVTLIALIKGCLPLHKTPTYPTTIKMKIPTNKMTWYVDTTIVN
jgi:hypothetical protein